MTARPQLREHFPAGPWWRTKLCALREYLKRTAPRAQKISANGSGTSQKEKR